MKNHFITSDYYIPKKCNNCQFNFDGICAAHESLYGYGNTITDDSVVCDEWQCSIKAFEEERNRYYGR